MIARGDLDDIAGYCTPADRWCRSAASGRKQMSKRVLRQPSTTQALRCRLAQSTHRLRQEVIGASKLCLHNVLPSLYLIEQRAVVTVDDGR